MIFSGLSKLFLLLLISTGLLLGCQTARQSSVNEPNENTNTSEEREPKLSSQRVAISSEEDALRVLKETPLLETDTWTGYYHSTMQENKPVLDGAFQIVSKQTVPDYSVPIQITYTGQYRKGVRYGEFIATVDGVEAETKYTLVYGENGKCQQGLIYQKGEGIVNEQVIEQPRWCTFKMLRDILYGL